MFGFGKSKVPPDFSGFHNRLEYLEEVSERHGKNIDVVANRQDDSTEQLDKLIERVSTLETKVANLNTIITAVAEGFNKAMEELEDV